MIARKYVVFVLFLLVANTFCIGKGYSYSINYNFEQARDANFSLKNSKLPICEILKINNKNTLKYIGESGNDLLECLNKNIDKNIYKLIITSNGGDVVTSVFAATIIKIYNIRVDVLGVCISSCANYIATATPYLTIRDFSILGLHGGSKPVSDEDVEKLLPRGEFTLRSTSEEINKLNEKTRIEIEKKAIISALRGPVNFQYSFQKFARVKDGLYDISQFETENDSDDTKYLFVVPDYNFFKACTSKKNFIKPYKYTQQDKIKIKSIVPFKGEILFVEGVNHNCN